MKIGKAKIIEKDSKENIKIGKYKEYIITTISGKRIIAYDISIESGVCLFEDLYTDYSLHYKDNDYDYKSISLSTIQTIKENKNEW